jgi:hypothetical protein
MLGGLAIVVVAIAWSTANPARPMLELAEVPTFQCGSISPGHAGRHSWLIRNAGATALVLRTRFTSGRSGYSLWQGQDHLIEPGGQVTTYLTWFTPGRPSMPFSACVILRTNDPEKPELCLRVVGISGPMIDICPAGSD